MELFSERRGDSNSRSVRSSSRSGSRAPRVEVFIQATEAGMALEGGDGENENVRLNPLESGVRDPDTTVSIKPTIGRRTGEITGGVKEEERHENNRELANDDSQLGRPAILAEGEQDAAGNITINATSVNEESLKSGDDASTMPLDRAKASNDTDEFGAHGWYSPEQVNPNGCVLPDMLYGCVGFRKGCLDYSLY